MGSSIPHIDLYIALCHSIPYWHICWDWYSEMCVTAPFTLPCGSTNSNLKVSQICPIDQIIYHFVAFIQLLLFMCCNTLIFFFVCFVNASAEKMPGFDKVIKTMLYPTMVTAEIYVWIIAAPGMRWWPSRDHLSYLVPHPIKNTTMTKCRSTLFY